MKYIIKLVPPISFKILNTTTRKIKVAPVACICGLRYISIGQCSTTSTIVILKLLHRRIMWGVFKSPIVHDAL